MIEKITYLSRRHTKLPDSRRRSHFKSTRSPQGQRRRETASLTAPLISVSQRSPAAERPWKIRCEPRINIYAFGWLCMCESSFFLFKGSSILWMLCVSILKSLLLCKNVWLEVQLSKVWAWKFVFKINFHGFMFLPLQITMWNFGTFFFISISTEKFMMPELWVAGGGGCVKILHVRKIV